MTELFTPATPDQEPNYLDYVKAKFGKEDGTIDIEALAKAKFKSDEHIANLENEQKGVREELTKRLSFEEVLAKIEANRQAVTATTNHVEPEVTTGDAAKSLTPEEIKKLTLETLTQEQQKSTLKSNVEQVRSELTKAWGPDFADKLKKVCAELDISEEEASTTAASKPKAFLRLVLGSEAPKVNVDVAPVRSSARMDTVAHTGVKNWAYYERIRLSNPAEYWTPRVQLELHNQARKLGADFRS